MTTAKQKKRDEMALKEVMQKLAATPCIEVLIQFSDDLKRSIEQNLQITAK